MPAKKRTTASAGRSRSQVSRSQNRGPDAARARSAGWRKQVERQQRNRRLGFIALTVTLVAVVVLVVVLVFVQRAGQKADTKNINAAAPARLVDDLSSVPASTFNSIGDAGLGKTVLGLKAVSGTPDVVDGKPSFIYVGGEFCPYCAAERWVIVTALDRFGSFSGLETTRSAADDGNYATLTFVHAKYTSDFVAFDGKEIYDRARHNLQKLSKAAAASYAKFGSVGSVPYFSVNNAFIGSYQYNPQELDTLSASAIAAQIKAGRTDLAKNVIASANILTAAVCTQTNNRPATVCSSAAVQAASSGLSSTTTASGSPSSSSGS